MYAAGFWLVRPLRIAGSCFFDQNVII